ncbi:MAG: NUDIX hydrolase [Nocardioides sp.]
MDLVALVGLLDSRGWLLLQERDEHAPVDLNKWGLVGGGVERGETSAAAAQRELTEETGIACDYLVALGSHLLPCVVQGEDHVDLFTARMPLTDVHVECREGRQIVFVEPNAIASLNLTDMTRALFLDRAVISPRMTEQCQPSPERTASSAAVRA